MRLCNKKKQMKKIVKMNKKLLSRNGHIIIAQKRQLYHSLK